MARKAETLDRMIYKEAHGLLCTHGDAASEEAITRAQRNLSDKDYAAAVRWLTVRWTVSILLNLASATLPS